MKSLYVWISVLTAGGVAISIYLMPSKEDMALLELKSDKLRKAAQYFEGQYYEGNREADIIIPLTILNEKRGNLQAAITLMEEYSKNHPDDMVALKKLADLYQSNQQYKEYFATLLQIQKRDPEKDADVLSALSEWYQNKNATEPLYATLKDLISTGRANGDDYLTFAYLSAQRGDYSTALSLLSLHRESFAKDVTIYDILFEVWLDFQISKTSGGNKELEQKAVDLMAQYLLEKRNPQMIHYAISVFNENYPDYAEELVSRIKPLIEKDPSLMLATYQLLWTTPEEKNQLLPLLLKLYQADPKNRSIQNMIFNAYLERSD
jgi:hypothetical protein